MSTCPHKSSSPALLQVCLRNGMAAARSFWSFLSSRLNKPSSLQSVFTGEVFQPSDHLHGLFWTHSNIFTCFWRWWPQNCTQSSRWCFTSVLWKRITPSTFWPHCLWHSPGHSWLSGLWVPTKILNQHQEMSLDILITSTYRHVLLDNLNLHPSTKSHFLPLQTGFVL